MFFHPEDRKKFGTAGIHFAKAHTWSSKLRLVNEKYEQVLAASSVREHAEEKAITSSP
jgi:hypothetical protein